MRFLLAIVIWIVFVGGLKLYTVKRDSVLPTEPAAPQQLALAGGDYSIRLTPTFSVERDPFALQTEADNSSGFDLTLNGSPLDVSSDQVRRGEMFELTGIKNILHGHNELYIKASPPLGESMLDQAIRIQVFESNVLIASQTIWGEKGSLVSGTVNFTISAKEHGHGH